MKKPYRFYNRLQYFCGKYDLTYEYIANRCHSTVRTIEAIANNKFVPSVELALLIIACLNDVQKVQMIDVYNLFYFVLGDDQ